MSETTEQATSAPATSAADENPSVASSRSPISSSAVLSKLGSESGSARARTTLLVRARPAEKQAWPTDTVKQAIANKSKFDSYPVNNAWERE